MLVLLDLLTGWTLFLSLALAIGAVVMRWVVLPRPDRAGAPSFDEGRASAARVGLRATGLLLIALILVLARQLIEFHDPFGSWRGDARLLVGGTAWGTTWIIGVAVAALTTIAFSLARGRRRGGWLLATAGVLALGAFPGLIGHANAGEFRAVTLIADTLHVWAMGAWIGTLGLILVFERRYRSKGEPGRDGSLLPTFVPRFSPVAVVSVGTLVLTGVLAAWIHLASVSALVTTSYGRLLLLKVSLVVAVLGLGALNWRRLTPLLGEASGQRSMRQAATLEFVVANIVLLVTALLVRTSPM